MASNRELHEEIKEGLLEHRHGQKPSNPKRQTLLQGIKRLEVATVERMLNQGLDPNFKDSMGSFPLHLACETHSSGFSQAVEEIVERLLFMGAYTDAHDRFSRIPLHIAAFHSSQLVRTLLEKGSNVNAQDDAGTTALMGACCHNNHDAMDTVDVLLQSGANVHLADTQGLTALHHIACNCSLDTPTRSQIALRLLQAGADVRTRDHQGLMAVCYELQKVLRLSWRKFPQVNMQLVDMLICGGATLQHTSDTHRFWVRHNLNFVHSKILCALLQMYSTVLTKSCLRMIKRAALDVKPGSSDDAENFHLHNLVSSLLRHVDSLQSMCRRNIRSQLQGTVYVSVHQLPLPEKLQRFLVSLESVPT